MLYPSHPSNYYDAFNGLPSPACRDKLNQAALLIENWHSLMPPKPAELKAKRITGLSREEQRPGFPGSSRTSA